MPSVLHFYTSTYAYNGTDRLDITIKGQHPFGRFFAPTWKMVNAYKNNALSWDRYAALYTQHMRECQLKHPEMWYALFVQPCITLVCFCSARGYCHRFTLAEILQSMGAVYLGEH